MEIKTKSLTFTGTTVQELAGFIDENIATGNAKPQGAMEFIKPLALEIRGSYIIIFIWI